MNVWSVIDRIVPGPRQTVERTEPDFDAGIWPAVESFWDSLAGAGFSPRLIERVWTANRCIQLNAQQIASMPLRFFGGSPSAAEPAWVANPDPNWYPNGIGDAIFSAAWSIYSWGDAFLYITDRYNNGFPRSWTVLDPAQVDVQLVNGRREYRSASVPLFAGDVVQISRDPRGGLRGTSALRSYAPHVAASITSAELGKKVMSGDVPNAILSSEKKLEKQQAQALKAEWAEASASRHGEPAILPPGLTFEQLAFSPKDLALLENQEFEARVVASCFGVPPFMLNMPLAGGLTYQSPEMLLEGWWRTELSPASKRITQALSAQMLPRGSWVEADSREALAPTFAELVDSWSKLLADKAVTVDEYRAAVLKLPPMAQGQALDDLTVPTVAATNNVQPLRPPQLTGMEVTSQ